MDRLVVASLYSTWYREADAMTEIMNLMEDAVKTTVDELFEVEAREKMLGYCVCDQCRLDVSCYALNRLKPEYIVSSRGLAYSEKEGSDKIQRRADLISLVKEGWAMVAHRPRPQTDHGAKEGHSAQAPQGPVINFPTIMGRVLDGRTFAPLDEGSVSLLNKGELVPMVGQSWQNPFVLARATGGTYIFWPAPEKAARDERRTCSFEIKIEVPGLEALSHFIELELSAEKEPRHDFSMQNIHKLPDIFTFPEGQDED